MRAYLNWELDLTESKYWSRSGKVVPPCVRCSVVHVGRRPREVREVMWCDDAVWVGQQVFNAKSEATPADCDCLEMSRARRLDELFDEARDIIILIQAGVKFFPGRTNWSRFCSCRENTLDLGQCNVKMTSTWLSSDHQSASFRLPYGKLSQVRDVRGGLRWQVAKR